MTKASSGEIHDVSDTAIWVAQYRAEENERPDALFRDPLAKVLVGERGAIIAKSFGAISPYTAWTIVARTVIIDEYIHQGIRGGIDGVLNLGAGLDTRPYRLDLPSSLPWVEADFPHLIQYKEEKLRGEKPRCQLQRVGVDLADANARREFLANVLPHARRVLVLTEGVVPYLSEAQVAELAADLRAQPRFACWVLEYFSARMYRYLQRSQISKKLKNAPFRFFPADWMAFFHHNGWEHQDIHYFSEIAERFGRMPPFPWWAKILMRWARPERIAQARKMTGYLMLTPKR